MALARRRRQVWSWVIVVCVFWINLFVLGLFRSGGVLYVALVRTFNCSHELASWPFSLAGATLCMIGPLAGVLSRAVPIRVIVSIGVLITAGSVCACFFVNDVTGIVILLGIFHGIGTGLVCTLTPILLNQYFQEQRAIVCGIAYSGSTVGSFFWPPLLEFLISEYGLKGALLVYGGLMLHALWGSLLLLPVSEFTSPHQRSAESAEGKKIIPSAETCDTIPDLAASEDECERNGNSLDIYDAEIVLQRKLSNGDFCFSATKQNTLSPEESAAPLMNGPDAIRPAENRTDAYQNPSLRTRIMTAFTKDMSLLVNPYFLLITSSAVSFFFVFMTIIIIITDYAIDRGVSDKDAVFLLSIFGISDLMSKPLPGLLTYKKLLSTKGVLLVGGGSMGFLMLAMPYLESYVSFVIMTFVIGLMTGGLVFMPPVLLTEYLGIQQAAVAFGMSNFFIGVASLLRPMFIGYFKDTWGSYDGLFYSMAAMCIAATLLWFIEPVVVKLRKMRSNNPEESSYSLAPGTATA